MHKLYAISFLFFILLLCSCGEVKEGNSTSQSEDTTPKPPNVLFIAVDDLRPELASFGKEHIQSPNIDRIAAMGTVFSNAYCNVPVCGASRASIITGMRPLRNRFINYKTRITEDAPGAVTLHGHFKANGYHAAAMGKVLHHPNDREEDYSEANWTPGVGAGAGRDYQMAENIAQISGSKGIGPAFERGDVADSAYWDGKIAARAADFLMNRANASSDDEKPFFLAVGFKKPHLPFNAPAKYWDLYDSGEIKLPPTYFRSEDTPDAIFHNSGELRAYVGVPEDEILPEEYARKLIHGYYASLSYMDAQLGRVLDALEESGQADNTIIVLWGDHGWNLGDHTMWCKHTPFNTSLRVPLIFAVPGYKAGRSPGMVEFVDIFPTLCDLAGLEKPSQLQGKSLLPLMEDPSREWSDAVFTRWHSADNITTTRYSYTEWYDDEGKRYARSLFDHETDSLEVNNLAEKDDYKEIVSGLAARLPIGASE